MIGFFNIYKPEGVSSNLVVVKIKKFLGTKNVGHMGTLDPMASGVLPIAIGKATRIFDYLTKSRKVYRATFQLGIKTDSDDITGSVIQTLPSKIGGKEISAILPKFIGKIVQIPSKYSAIKINGRRAYSLARQKIDFDMKSREVEIFDIKLVSFDSNDKTFTIDVVCEGGTYIRTLGLDIALALGEICTMTKLERRESSSFKVESSIPLYDFLNQKNVTPIAIERVLDLEVLNLNVDDFEKLSNGVKLNANDFHLTSQYFYVKKGDTLLGIGEVEGGFIRIKTNLFTGEN